MFAPDVPVSVAFGALIVASHLPGGSAEVSLGLREQQRTLYQVLLYGLLFHCLDSFFAFIWYPDWNLGYLVPFESITRVGGFFISYSLLLMLLLGRWLALQALVRFGRKGVWAVILAAFAVFGIVFAAVWHPYNHVGTYAQYHAGKAIPAAEDPVFTMFTTLAGLYLIMPLLVLLGWNRFMRR